MGKNDNGCNDVKAKLVDYLDEELQEHDRLSVELHLEKCYACREELEELGKLLELCGAVLPHPSPCERLDELKQRLASVEPEYEPAPRPRLTTRQLALRLAVAAIILAVAIASPFIVKGIARLLTPIEDSASLLGDGTNIKQIRSLIESSLEKQEGGAEELTHDGTQDSVPTK
jgi:anti-sigma factor RsiW